MGGREKERRKNSINLPPLSGRGKKKRNSGREIIKNAIRTGGAWEGEER